MEVGPTRLDFDRDARHEANNARQIWNPKKIFKMLKKLAKNIGNPAKMEVKRSS